MIDYGFVRPGTTLYIPFASYAGSTGASAATTGLATSDIEIYKDGSTTQRGSDSGYALLDTDGLDFDGITGLNGFSIDLADNTTANFYASGSQYWVVVSTVTVDSQTVSFVAATFRIGYQDAILNTTIASLSSQTSFTLTSGPAEDDALNGCQIVIHDVASAVQVGRAVVLDYTGSTKTVTLAAATTFTAAAGDNIAVLGLAPLQPTTTGRTLDVSSGGEAGVDWANVGSPTTSLALTGTTIAVTQKVDVETIKTNPVVNGGTITFPTGATLASTTNITAGTITTTTNLTNLPAITANWLTAAGTATDFGTEVGTAVLSALGTGTWLTAVPWNAAWDNEVQSECDDALQALGYTSTVSGRIDAAISTRLATAFYTSPPSAATIAVAVRDVANGSGAAAVGSLGEVCYTAMIVAAGASGYAENATNKLGAWAGSGNNTVLGGIKALASASAATPSDIGGTFDPATDSAEALRNRGDAAWTTATGFSTHSASDVWSVDTRTLSAGTNIQLPANGLANVTAWTVAITGNITGNLSGSVGSVTAGVTVSDKTGFKLASDGLDTIATTAPTGIAANFREMLVQLWRRYFKRVSRSSTEIKTYADNGTTVLTTQAYTASSTDDNVGAAT